MTSPPRNGIEQAKRHDETLDWLQAEGDLERSRERHGILLLKMHDSINHLVSEFGRHLTHPHAHEQSDATRLHQRHPKATATAGGVGLGGAVYGLIELIRLIAGS